MSDGVFVSLGLSCNFLDGGLSYKENASCFAEAQNTGMEMRYIVMLSLSFTCIRVPKGRSIRLGIPLHPRSWFLSDKISISVANISCAATT